MFSSNTSAVSGDANYIEDVFSTWLYNGNDTGQTITNNIDLSTKGGMLWIKRRSSAGNNGVVDTARGRAYMLFTNTTDAQSAASGSTQDVTSFNTNGFSIGTNNVLALNTAGSTYTSWSFRKQPKFFDVVTYTGTGSAQNVAHSLGAVPGFIVYKRTSGVANWCVLARKSNGTYESLYLNTTGATQYTAADATEAGLTSTTFNPSAIFGGESNGTTGGGAYVAYLFANDAGGFGLTGTDNVISCGSFTTDSGGNATVNLGYEPQYILFKRTDSSTGGDWYVYDTMRGMPNNAGTSTTAAPSLSPNTSAAELNWQQYVNATGFVVGPGAYSFAYGSATYIYIAIRRGPMKVPTDATKVFKPITYTGTSSTRDITGVGFPLDMNITMDRATHTYNVLSDRLRGLTCNGTPSQTQPQLRTNATDAETAIQNGLNGTLSSAMDGYTLYGAYSQMNASPDTYISYNFRRAPSFFDEVCYTGTGSNTTQTHNLGVVPELVIVRARDNTNNWQVYNAVGGVGNNLLLNTAQAYQGGSPVSSLTSTSAVFAYNADYLFDCSGSGVKYVAYLFATCAGVSKIGGYTGNGSSQTINCGFSAGARFILIKRTDAGGDWYVWDTARGIVSSSEPHLSLNNVNAEVSDDTIDPDSSGFIVNQLSATNVNVNAATYIFLAIA